MIHLVLFIHLQLMRSLAIFILHVTILGIYSGGDKTSVESLGGDFSINNASNPRNLGAK